MVAFGVSVKIRIASGFCTGVQMQSSSQKHTTQIHPAEVALCGRSSDYSQETYCELPGGDVCVLIRSVPLEGQGSGTVGIFTSMQQ